MKRLILRLIRGYQKTKIFRRELLQKFFLSDACCRFQPTCSQYSYSAIKKYGIIRGSLLSLKRIVKCHPWSRGGSDPLK